MLYSHKSQCGLLSTNEVDQKFPTTIGSNACYDAEVDSIFKVFILITWLWFYFTLLCIVPERGENLNAYSAFANVLLHLFIVIHVFECSPLLSKQQSK